MVVDRRCIDYDRGGYLCPDAKGEIAGGSNRKDQSTNARRRGGAAHSRNEGSVMEERLQTASPRRSPAVTWSRVLSRCSTPTTMATGPAALQSLPCARHAQRCWRADWVLDIDVKDYFDSIDWELLLRAVRRHTDCPWVLLYIDRWLKAPVQVEDGSVVPRTAGTPQGGVVSPLLANLFLHYAFDMWMARTYPHIPFERYATISSVTVRAPKRRGRYGARLLIALRSASWCCIRRRRRPSTVRMQIGVAIFRANRSTFSVSFRARKTLWRGHIHTHGFLPAARPQALTSISRAIRRWALHHHSDKSLQDMARWRDLARLHHRHSGERNRDADRAHALYESKSNGVA